MSGNDPDVPKSLSPATKWELFDMVSEQALINMKLINALLRAGLSDETRASLSEVFDRSNELYNQARELVVTEGEADG